MEVYTASFFKIPRDQCRARGVSIAIGEPKGIEIAWKIPSLQPGRAWFKTAPRDQYEKLYLEHLRRLDPKRILGSIPGHVSNPILLCWEDLANPALWCHRTMVARWLQETIGLRVVEMDRAEQEPPKKKARQMLLLF